MALFNRPTPPTPPPTPPAPQNSSGLGSIFGRSLFGGPKQTPMPEQKSPTKPGLFGEPGKSGFKKFTEQRWFALKQAPYKPLPGTVQKLGPKERAALTDKLQKRAMEAGQTYGLSNEKYQRLIRPKIIKDIYQLGIQNKFAEKKQLERELRQYDEWIKGI